MCNIDHDFDAAGLLNGGCKFRITGLTDDFDLVDDAIDVFFFLQGVIGGYGRAGV